MCYKARAAGPDSWLVPSAQEDFLEHRASLLARRHLHDTGEGRDTSYDVLQVTMAHADLTYWRGLQTQIQNTPEQQRETTAALANVVSLPLN